MTKKLPLTGLDILKSMARAVGTKKGWQKRFLKDTQLTRIALLSLQPKKTKVFARKFIKEILETDSTLHLAIIAHLYFEAFLNAIIKKRFKKPDYLLGERYHAKLKVITATGKLSDVLYYELNFINFLRNQYAHNLNYSLDHLDKIPNPSLKKMFTEIKKVNGAAKRKKMYREILRNYFIFLMWDLSSDFRELYLL